MFDTLSDFLRTGLVPADLRATVYEAIAGLPDVVVTDDQASLDGRHGTAIGLGGRQRSDSDRREVIIDPATGAYLGERTLQTRRIGSIPAGSVVDSVAVAVDGVDRLP